MESVICPRFDKAVQLLGKPWMGLLLYLLLDGPKRFHHLEEQISISGRVLSVRLKELEQEGIIHREVFLEVPIKVEYSLTEKGKAMKPVIEAIENWSKQWLSIEKARE